MTFCSASQLHLRLHRRHNLRDFCGELGHLGSEQLAIMHCLLSYMNCLPSGTSTCTQTSMENDPLIDPTPSVNIRAVSGEQCGNPKNAPDPHRKGRLACRAYGLWHVSMGFLDVVTSRDLTGKNDEVPNHCLSRSPF